MTEKRPILTLKRKKPPAADATMPAAAPVTVKHRKTLPPLEKKMRVQEPAPAPAQKKKNKPKVLRLLDHDEALSTLCAYWPALFSKDEVKLLALHIFGDLHQAQIDRNLPLSGKQLRRCIKTYVLSPAYLHATQAGATRYGIEGRPAGQVTEKEQAWAEKQLAKSAAQANAAATEGQA